MMMNSKNSLSILLDLMSLQVVMVLQSVSVSHFHQMGGMCAETCRVI